MHPKYLILDSLLVIDETGMPVPPTVRQLIDRDVRELYRRDTTKDKEKYIAECIVIYYLGDPKSPARQSGLSEVEALKLAKQVAGLPDNYVPDALVARLIQRYYNENITEAGKVLENINQTIHNMNLAISSINNLLNEKLNGVNGGITLDNAASIMSMIDVVSKKASDFPNIIKNLDEAKQNLIEEKNTEVARGGGVVLSSMNADEH